MVKEDLNVLVRNQLTDILASNAASSGQDQASLNNALRLLAKWRSVLIQNTLLQKNGTVVMQGPLAGLDFLAQSAEGCHIAKLLGCYEQPLQPFIEAAINEQYSTVINVGCAEGYYAVGMARCMTETLVYAYDTNVNAQQVCADLAEKNGVAKRIKIGGLLSAETLSNHSGEHALLLVDIEGAEQELLDPEVSPVLRSMSIIVESHECLIPGITNLLVNRFKQTHQITIVQDDGQRNLANAPNWFLSFSHLDQLLATWEWRIGATPWLVMKPLVKGV